MLAKSGHEIEVQNGMVEGNGRLKAAIGFKMERDENRIGFAGHVIAVFRTRTK